MNKNAYEIRLELLSLAHGDMQNCFYEKLNLLKEADQRAYESHRTEFEEGNDRFRGRDFKSIITAEKIDALLPSSAAIIARAEELYRFIEGK